MFMNIRSGIINEIGGTGVIKIRLIIICFDLLVADTLEMYFCANTAIGLIGSFTLREMDSTIRLCETSMLKNNEAICL